MSLILAIERDGDRARLLQETLHGRLGADLVMAESVELAVNALSGRVPDLILTSPLLPPREDAAVAQWLRRLGASAAHVQTLAVPILAAGGDVSKGRAGVLSALRREPRLSLVQEGCDPAVFAEQVGLYLKRAAEKATDRDAESAGVTEQSQWQRIDPDQPHVRSLLDRLDAFRSRTPPPVTHSGSAVAR